MKTVRLLSFLTIFLFVIIGYLSWKTHQLSVDKTELVGNWYELKVEMEILRTEQALMEVKRLATIDSLKKELKNCK